jgi:hypothetical protein
MRSSLTPGGPRQNAQLIPKDLYRSLLKFLEEDEITADQTHLKPAENKKFFPMMEKELAMAKPRQQKAPTS